MKAHGRGCPGNPAPSQVRGCLAAAVRRLGSGTSKVVAKTREHTGGMDWEWEVSRRGENMASFLSMLQLPMEPQAQTSWYGAWSFLLPCRVQTRTRSIDAQAV